MLTGGSHGDVSVGGLSGAGRCQVTADEESQLFSGRVATYNHEGSRQDEDVDVDVNEGESELK